MATLFCLDSWVNLFALNNNVMAKGTATKEKPNKVNVLIESLLNIFWFDSVDNNLLITIIIVPKTRVLNKAKAVLCYF